MVKFYISRNFDNDQVNALMQQLKKAMEGPSVSTFLNSLPDKIYVIIPSGQVEYLGERQLPDGLYLEYNSDGHYELSTSDQISIDKVGTIGVDPGSAKISPSDLGSTDGLLNDFLSRSLFHELAHAVQSGWYNNGLSGDYAGLSKAFNAPTHAGVEALAVAAENYIYAKDNHRPQRIGHLSTFVQRSADPSLPFRNIDQVLYRQITIYTSSGQAGEFYGNTSDGFNIYKDYYQTINFGYSDPQDGNISSKQDNYILVGATGSGIISTDGALSGAANDVLSGIAHASEEFIHTTLKKIADKYENYEKINKDILKYLQIDSNQFSLSLVNGAIGVSNERFTDANMVYENYVGPHDFLTKNPSNNIFLYAKDSSIVFGSSGYYSPLSSEQYSLNNPFQNSNDVIYGSTYGHDILIAGNGSNVDGAFNRLSSAGQYDALVGGDGNDHVNAVIGANIILQSGGDDVIYGNKKAIFVLSNDAGCVKVDTNFTEHGNIAIKNATGVTVLRNVAIFDAGDSKAEFWGNGNTTFITGSAGNSYHLKSGDIVIESDYPDASNSFYVNSSDVGKIRIANFKENDKLFVDGNRVLNITVRSHVIDTPIMDVGGGANHDWLQSNRGVQTTITGSLDGSINSLKYIAGKPGDFLNGPGTAKVLVELVPSSDQPQSVVSFFITPLDGGSATGDGLQLAISGYQDGYGGIRVRSDAMSLAQMATGPNGPSYVWSGSVFVDNRGYFIDSAGVKHRISNKLYSPYDKEWHDLTTSIAGSADEMMADPSTSSGVASTSDGSGNSADAGGPTATANAETDLQGVASAAQASADALAAPTDSASVLTGDGLANQFDTGGAYSVARGSGGGDTFVYSKGYSTLWIEEFDAASAPSNVLSFGADIAASSLTVFGTVNGDIVIDAGNGDVVVLVGALLGRDASGQLHGVQSVQFADGTTWTYADLAAKASQASSQNPTIAGDTSANTFDSLGLAREIVGNGGGDTISYNRGYGQLVIDEQDSDADPINLLAFGDGITQDMLSAFGTQTGDIVLDLGDGDQILLKGALLGRDAAGITHGIQSFTFADGTALSSTDIVNIALTPSADHDTLYGDTNANWIDSGGVASQVVGNGGGDTIYYQAGYGLLTIDEQDNAAAPVNTLELGYGIDSSQVTVTADAQGNLWLGLGGTDTVVILGALNSDGVTTRGIQNVQFADGTIWSYADLLGKADTASAANTELFGDRAGNILDSLGIATTITGSGGGDTFVYDAGYGALAIKETDLATAPQNVLQLGAGLAPSALTVEGNAKGDLVLSFGGEDVITLVDGLNSGNGKAYGVQTVQFADGTELSCADLLALASTATANHTSIFGDATDNTLDTAGLATEATGGGGGDVFLYARGYGAVRIDERDTASAPSNVIHFAPGIAASDLLVTASPEGDLVVSLGNGDVVTLVGALDSLGGVTKGVQSLVFSDGSSLSYADLLQRVGTPASGGVIYGDTTANVLDTGGLATSAVGNGGGDTFLFNVGYGNVVIDERDATGLGDNGLELGAGIDPAAVAVAGTPDGDLLLNFGGGDSVLIRGALKADATNGTVLGLQYVAFSDGTTWSYSDLLSKVEIASASTPALYGDTAANVLDGKGLTHSLIGNGGGDTFVFDVGYGQLRIDEQDASRYAANSISLGAGLSPDNLSVSVNEAGDLVLDFGSGDVITLVDGIIGRDDAGITHGVQSLAFADGTQLSFQDILDILQTPTANRSVLYGSSAADIFDTKGIATRIVGNGGGDTIYYNLGYGNVVIEERDVESGAENRLILGEGIAPGQISVTTNANDDLILTLGAGATITLLKGALEGQQTASGVQSIEFADGTIWDRDAIDAFLHGQPAIEFTGTSKDVDFATLPATAQSNLSINALPGAVTVTLSADGQQLILQTTEGTLTLSHFYASNAFANQSLTFADGTVWHISDALAQVSNWDDVGTVLFGTEAAESFFAGGHFNMIDGGGGGDTIFYKRGDGALQLTEADGSVNLQNRIVLGAGITASDLQVTADSDNMGSLLLDFGNGDVIRLPDGIHVSPDASFGVQSLVFSDGQALSYADLMELADTGSASNSGTLIGDSSANTIDTKGFGHRVIGNGGGDTFVYASGYGQLMIDESDTAAAPSNVLRLGPGILPANVVVSSDGTSITLQFSADDSVVLNNALASRPGAVKGVQQVIFDDGTTWSAGDLLQKVSTAVSGATTIYGDATANVLDPAGIARTVVGNGGGDTIVFNRGYGSVSIEELDYGATPANTLLFGAGIAPRDVTPVLQGVGAFALKLSGGDEVYFTGTNTTQTTSNYGAASGIQRVQFQDGTVWSYDQLLAMADAPSATHKTLYGDVNANTFDPLGVAHAVEGGGGGDTIVYNAGYGALDITEYESGNATNVLQFGAGITPQSVAFSTYGGALVLSLGGGDIVTIHPGYTRFGISEIRFADGTVWNSDFIGKLLSPSASVNSEVLGTSVLTGAINKRVNSSSPATALSTSGTIDFNDNDPSDTHTAWVTSISLDGNIYSLSSSLPEDSLKSWFSINQIVEAGSTPGSIDWTFSAPAGALDFLSAGNFVDIAFNVEVRDANGNAFSKVVKVYLNGVSATPPTTAPAVLSTTVSQAQLSEATDQTSGYSWLGASGTLQVSDAAEFLDYRPTLVSVSATGATSGLPASSQMLNWLYLGFLNTSVVSGVNRGSASWSFSAQDSQFDYLGAGDSVTLTYQTEISDRYGNKVRIPITISVVGTNDQPQIASGGSTYAYLTSPVGDVEQSVQVQGDGNLTFTDVDVHDAHTASVSGVTVSDGWTGMPDETTLLALLSLDPVSEPGATDTGNVAWHFASGSGLFSGLSLDQTATLNYTVEISDGHGGTLDQTITVSVTGVQAAPPANRAPSLNLPDVIVSSTNAAVAVAGLSVSDPDSNAYEQVTLIAGHGRLKVAPDSAGVSLSGNNGRAVTIYGSVADVNSALSGLTYQGLSGVRDDILVTASDGELRDQRTIAVVATEQSGTSGDDVINGAADSAKLEGLQGDDMITAGSGGDFIVGGAGNDTLTGGLGSDIFKFEANSGIDTVYNFSATGPTHDVLQFNSKIFSDWAHLLGATTQVGSDLEIVLDQSDKITLKNVAIANFTSSDAKFI